MTSDWKRKIIRGFDAGADHYDLHNDVQRQVAQTLSDHIPDQDYSDILEIGCGTGTFTAHLFDQYPDARFCITDISDAMLTKAQHVLDAPENVQWCSMDGERFDLSRKFDLIISNMAFQWFENPARSLEMLKSHLKPSGVLLFSVPSSACFPEWRSALSELSLEHGFSRQFDWPDVIHTEQIAIDYGSTLQFLKHLKAIGAQVPDQNYMRISPSMMRRACRLSDHKFHGRMTWDIVYGCFVNAA